MIQPVDYNTLLATVNPDDLAMLTSFTVGVSVKALTQDEVNGYYTQAQRLYDAGLLTRMSRDFFNDDSGLPFGVSATVAPQVVGYVAKLAHERILLSRGPLP